MINAFLFGQLLLDQLYQPSTIIWTNDDDRRNSGGSFCQKESKNALSTTSRIIERIIERLVQRIVERII